MVVKRLLTALLFSLVGSGVVEADEFFVKTQSAPEVSAGEAESVVYVLRIAQSAMAIKFWAFADDQLLGVTRGKTCTAAVVPAGQHTFWSRAENVSAFDLEVAAGETYYLQQKVRMGGMKARVKFEELSETEGQAALAKCKNYSTLTEAGRQRGSEIAAEKLEVARKKAGERKD